jgi:4a-hydroxytetrahydrobiopterin dehydratase
MMPGSEEAELDIPLGWTNDGQALTKTFDRRSFDGSIAFVNAVAAVANRLDHHPDIALSWNEVTIRTWSHDVGAVTERDAALARAIDAIA